MATTTTNNIGTSISINTSISIGTSIGNDDAVTSIRGRIKGSWSPKEDATLVKMVEQYGPRNWSLISSRIPGRSGKSCRLRWCNQLSPDVEHRPFSSEEDGVIVRAHAIHGNKWSTISRLLPGRTDNAIKNYWNSTLRRRGVTGAGLKRSVDNGSNGSTGSTQSDNKRQCCSRGGEPEPEPEPETVLTLLPPGKMKAVEHVTEAVEDVTENDEEVEDDVEGRSTVEMDNNNTCLVTIMKRMIAKEVRSYIDELRAKGGLCFDTGPGFKHSAQN